MLLCEILFLFFVASFSNTKISRSLRYFKFDKHKNEEIPYKFWIYFKDKNCPYPDKPDEIIKEKDIYFSKSVLDRRKKTRQILYDERDYPICEYYVNEVLKIINDPNRIHVKSNWMNGITVWNLNLNEITEISKFFFTKNIEVVKNFQKPKIQKEDSVSVNLNRSPDIKNQRKLKKIEKDDNVLEYGNSLHQLQQINVTSLHREGFFGSGVKILVLDSGFHLQHRAFRNLKVIGTKNFVNKNDNVDVEFDHGSKVCSIIGGDDSGNLYGPAFKAEYLLAKTEDLKTETPIEEDNFLAAIEWGEKQGAQVLSSSLGYTDWYKSSDYDGRTGVITKAVNMAIENGIVCVISAGNEGSRGLSAPSDSFFVISVGAVKPNGEIASFSSRGPTYDKRIKPEICAQGYSTYAAIPNNNNGYTRVSGTSFSAPLIAGGVALIVEKNPTWSPQKIRRALMVTASNAHKPGNSYGYGIANIGLASEHTDHECECVIPRTKIFNGYFFTCNDIYKEGCVDNPQSDGYWVCEKGSNFLFGTTCVNDSICTEGYNCDYDCVDNKCIRDYICDENNCNHICMNNKCVEVFICFGKNDSDLSVCSGKGECVKNDKCECNRGYKGNECNDWDCNSINKDDENVWGICEKPDLCSCSVNYEGFFCETKVIDYPSIGLIVCSLIFLLFGFLICFGSLYLHCRKRKKQRISRENFELIVNEDDDEEEMERSFALDSIEGENILFGEKNENEESEINHPEVVIFSESKEDEETGNE